MEPCAIVPLTHAGDFEGATTPVAGEAPLVRVVRSVLDAVADERVVVATVPALAAATVECLRAAGLATAVAVAPEPESRQRVIRAGLEHLGAEAHTAVSVLVCDHRYPLAPGQLAERVLAALADGHDVVVPILPVTDTVKAVDELGSVLSTVDRSALRTVQYPRGFTASALWQLISVSAASASDDLDEFDAALLAGLDIGTVDGDANAFQVELPRDAHLLDAVIACRPG
ncbi:MAG: 2-C-methyl-D-erythritol 4-phosphate cytidylyltransferase [Mycobacterium sp.]|jgi:2-C-methyl-D-erythritol 4-phosphate cytidylyltransferase|nr:2-C-methyl-D-erythritol 4-phosphate cytidylyltransferase [Mycobacterium sp.]